MSKLGVVEGITYSQTVASSVMAREPVGDDPELVEDTDEEGWPAAVDVALEATRQEGCVQRAYPLGRSSWGSRSAAFWP